MTGTINNSMYTGAVRLLTETFQSRPQPKAAVNRTDRSISRYDVLSQLDPTTDNLVTQQTEGGNTAKSIEAKPIKAKPIQAKRLDAMGVGLGVLGVSLVVGLGCLGLAIAIGTGTINPAHVGHFLTQAAQHAKTFAVNGFNEIKDFALNGFNQIKSLV